MNCDNAGKRKHCLFHMGQSLKQSFVTFEHSLNRLVLPKTAQGREKVSGVEKGTQPLFSEIPCFPDEKEIARHILENHSA